MASSQLYTTQINRLQAALRLLPTHLPLGNSIYNFQGWCPDPERLDTFGSECGVLNADLENVFGLRAISPLTFKERGPGIESLIDLFTKYLLGDYAEKPVLAKWLQDLITTAEEVLEGDAATVQSKRASKPSAAQKRSNEYIELEASKVADRKRLKLDAVAKENERTAEISKTAQDCNWKYGFDNLEDIPEDKSPYTTGQRGYAEVNKLVIKCKSKKTNQIRYRCSAAGCQKSWTERQPQCWFAHAIEECRFIDPDLLTKVSEAAAKLALGSKVLELNSQDPCLPESMPSGALEPSASDKSTSQPSVFSAVTTAGRKAKQICFDLSVVNFVCAAQIAPRKVDLPEFDKTIQVSDPYIKPKSGSYLAQCLIPMESAQIRRITVDELQHCKNLTISFDRGTAIRPQSFTTIHITVPETRLAHLMKAVEASGVSHTGSYYCKELTKVIEEIGGLLFSGISCDSTGNTRLARELINRAYPCIIILADPCHQLHNAIKDICQLEYFTELKVQLRIVCSYLSKSTFAATHFNNYRRQLGIARGIEKPGKTRFAGWYYCATSVRRSLPAIEYLVNRVIDPKKMKYDQFKRQLGQLEKVTAPFARAIKCLESGHSTVSDVFLFNLSIVASLRDLFDKNESELALPEDVVGSICLISKSRYYDMVLAAGNEVYLYLTGFFLHPVHRDTDILRRNNLNPLATGIVVLRPLPGSLNKIPGVPGALGSAIWLSIGLFLKKLLCNELSAGAILSAKNYPSTSEGVSSIIDVFKLQLAAYARAEYPFILPSLVPANFSPYNFWGKLLKHPDACFLAHLARKLFSLVPNSMAEERTVSCFTAINTKERSLQKVSTLAHMTRIRQHLLRKRQSTKTVHKPVLRYCDLSESALKQNPPGGVRSPNEDEGASLAEGWLLEDVEAEAAEDLRDLGVGNDLDADNDSDEEYEDVPDPIEPGAMDMASNDIDFYGIDTTNPALLDLLDDSPVSRVSGSFASKQPEPSTANHPASSAKKDTSGVDLDSY